MEGPAEDDEDSASLRFMKQQSPSGMPLELSEEDIPLKTLQHNLQKNTSKYTAVPIATLNEQQQRIRQIQTESSNDAGDTDSDDLISSSDEYKPEEESSDTISSDSDSKPRKAKTRIPVRDKGWKRKPSNIKIYAPPRKRKNKLKSEAQKNACNSDGPCQTNGNNPHDGADKGATRSQDGHSSSEENPQIKAAKEKSMNEHKFHQIVMTIHKKLLNKVLTSNGMKSVDIPSDGNCFLNATLEQMESNINSCADLRKILVNHLTEKKNHYIDFMAATNHSDNLEEVYDNEIEYLKEDGHWSSSLANCIPLAIANIYQCNIVMFTSKCRLPIIHIEPSIGNATSDKVLRYAFLAVPGKEHYDSCYPVEKPITATKNGNSKEQSPTKVTPPPKRRQAEKESPDITPRKQAKFTTPKKVTSVRKKKADPSSWKKNIKKRLHLTGKSYVSASGKHIPNRQVRPKDCSMCRYKCSENIPDEKRQEIFHNYWALGSFERQRDFICSSILETSCKRGKGNRKEISRVFSFEVDGQNIRVCKEFFVTTLDIGMKTIRCTMKRKSRGSFVGHDRRGRRQPHNKTTDDARQYVKSHIESFPTVESHYTRKNCSKKFLSSDLNIRKMHELYAAKCHEDNRKPVSERIYRKIFCEEYNISFHTPKKDQCLKCEKYKQNKQRNETTPEDENNYRLHINEKNRAREEKEIDKQKAIDDPTKYCATFDLEAILTTPCSLVSLAYYKRKLHSYNLSVYSLGNKRGTCYLWDESEGAKGSSEVSTCLLMHLQSLPSIVNHVILYSDTCTGQNRNQFVAATLLYAVRNSNNIKTVDQKFLISGHTQMECDSMHSAIEFAKKNTTIYVPSQWDTIVQMARRRNPYLVVPIKHHQVLDMKQFKTDFCYNFKVYTDGTRVNWLQIKWIRVTVDEPDCIKVKTDFDDADFKVIRVVKPVRGRPVKEQKIGQKYKQRLPISEKKKGDLLNLCTTGVIPREFHNFYKELPSVRAKKDRLPVPDVLESDEDTEDEQ